MTIFYRKDQALWIFMLVLMLILIGIFLPVSVKTWAGFGVKTGLFVSVFFLLYFFWFSRLSGFTPAKKSESHQKADSPEPHVTSEVVQWKGFSEAFSWFSRTFISVVRNATAASAIGLYLRKGDTFELQSAESDIRNDYPPVMIHEGSLIDAIVEQRSPVRNGDLPSGAMLTGVNDLEIRSFAGVPLMIENQLRGVIAAGSEVQDHFGEEDVKLLKHSADMICQVMTVYHRAWRREIQEAVWQTHLELEKMLRPVDNVEQAFEIFTQFLQKLFSFDRSVLCVSEKTEGVILHVYGQLDQYGPDVRFPLDEGVVGWVMKRNAPLVIEDLQEGSYVRPRYQTGEDSKHGFRAFLGVPLGQKACWGCVCLESKRIGHYTEREKNGLLTMLPFFELTLERLRLQEKIERKTD